ncbi:MAG: recombinase family protein [Terriglobales bacterium]
MRAAIYARYSHENSTSKSIVDQVAAVRHFANSIGAHVVREYHDAAVSGTSRHIRPGLKRLMLAYPVITHTH